MCSLKKIEFGIVGTVDPFVNFMSNRICYEGLQNVQTFGVFKVINLCCPRKFI